MTEKEMKKLEISSKDELKVKVIYGNCIELSTNQPHLLVTIRADVLIRNELVKNLQKKGYEVSKEDFHVGALGKSGGIRLFLKDESNGKDKNTYSFHNFDKVIEKWQDSDESLFKVLKTEDKDFKKFVKKTEKMLGEKGLLKDEEDYER